MRIVNVKEFLQLPLGTIFQKYEEFNFGALCYKGDSIGNNDLSYIDLCDAVDIPPNEDYFSMLSKALEDEKSFRLDFDTWRRDGLLEDRQLFAIWEKADVDGLMGMLRKVAFV